jgi:hypothetical protein
LEKTKNKSWKPVLAAVLVLGWIMANPLSASATTLTWFNGDTALNVTHESIKRPMDGGTLKAQLSEVTARATVRGVNSYEGYGGVSYTFTSVNTSAYCQVRYPVNPSVIGPSNLLCQYHY